MNTLTITRGLPGSGKSTWAIEETERRGEEVVRINRDNIRMEILGSYWTGKKADENKVTVVQQQRVREALSSGKDVIVDDTNVNPAIVTSWHRLAAEHDGRVQFAAKDFPVSTEECIRRDKVRRAAGERGVGPQVIESMAGRFLRRDGTFPALPLSVSRPILVPPAPEDRPNAVIFDVDGTLCDVRSVRHHVRPTEGNKRNFHAFHMDSLYCPANPEVVEMAKDARDAGLAVVVVTARERKYESVTERWMDAVGLERDATYMRDHGDQRPDYESKKDIYADLSKHYRVIHAVDDNPQVLKLWKELDISTTIVEGFDDPVDVNDVSVIPIDSPLKGGRCLRCNRKMMRDGVLGPECAKM